MRKILLCCVILYFWNVSCFSQTEKDKIRLTYYAGSDEISQRMNKVFDDTHVMDSLKHRVAILCIDMQSENIDTIPPSLYILNNVEQIEIEWKSEQKELYGFQMFPKLMKLTLFSSKLNVSQRDTTWLKQIKIFEIKKNSELNGLNSFSWIPNLEQLYIEFSKVDNPLPRDIDSLAKLKIFRYGP